MKISFVEPDRFVSFDCKFEERHVLKDAGFWFDKFDSTRVKKWNTTNYFYAATLDQYLDENAKKKIQSVSLIETSWGGGLSLPEGKRFSKSQIAGFEFATSRNHSYLAFDAGIGKTPLGVALMNALSKGSNTLLIIPPGLITQWVNEIKRWSTKNTLDIIDIIPDTQLGKYAIGYYDLVIVDEAHRFINEDSQRTQLLMRTVESISKRVFLSGSPIKKGPMHLYLIVRSSAWNLIEYAPMHQYGVQFCGAYKKETYGHHWAWDYSGSSNEDDFRKRLFDKFILRRKLKLKAKHIERVVNIDSGEIKAIKDLEKIIFGSKTLKEIIGSVSRKEIAKYRKALIPKTIPIAVSYIKDILDSTDESILVLGFHHEMIEELERKLKKYKPSVIYGKTKREERNRIQSDFAERRVRLIIASIPCMVGINLQAGTRNIFVESSWDYIDNYQASCRTYRRGQKKTVISDHLVIANTVGEYVMRTVLKKKVNYKKLMG